jgi:hypothetical protein
MISHIIIRYTFLGERHMPRQREDGDENYDPEKIAEVRKFFMDDVRKRASAGDAICGGLLALEHEYQDYIFLPEYDSDLSDLDSPGPF